MDSAAILAELECKRWSLGRRERAVRVLCLVLLLVCLTVRLNCLEKQAGTLARGGFGVIVKTGYGDDECPIDKGRWSAQISPEFTEAGNVAVSFTQTEKMEVFSNLQDADQGILTSI